MYCGSPETRKSKFRAASTAIHHRERSIVKRKSARRSSEFIETLIYRVGYLVGRENSIIRLK
jgi:hypothetical protein